MGATTQPIRPDPRKRDQAGLFRDRDFVGLWWIGLASFLIRWLEILVFGVFTYQATGSAFTVAMMTMLRLLPMALFGAVMGTLAERIVRHQALLLVVLGSLLTSLVLTVISYAGHLEVWHLAVASFINGTAWASDNPVRRSMLGDIAGPVRLGRAMSLEVGTSTAARLIGPGMGGFLLASIGIAGIFAMSSALYFSALIAVLILRHRDGNRNIDNTSFLASMAAGFSVLRRDPRMTGALWITVLFNLFGWPVLSMVPVIGKDQLGLDPGMVGLLASSDGLGALLSAMIVARLSAPGRYGRIYVLGLTLFLLMLIPFALAPHPALAGMALFFSGVGQAGFAIMQATLMLVLAPPGLRSQAMGLITMCIGTGPLGFLMLGALAEQVGAPATAVTLSLSGLLLLAVSWPWWRQLWRT